MLFAVATTAITILVFHTLQPLDTFPHPPDASTHRKLWFLFHKYFLSLLIVTMSFLSHHHLLLRNSLQIGLL